MSKVGIYKGSLWILNEDGSKEPLCDLSVTISMKLYRGLVSNYKTWLKEHEDEWRS